MLKRRQKGFARNIRPLPSSSGRGWDEDKAVEPPRRIWQRVAFSSRSVAIIGIGCRFPGSAHDPKAFWRLLQDGVDAIVDIPGTRWDSREYYDSDLNKAGKIFVRQAGFLTAPVDCWDPTFFAISPREAATTDPQQSLLLETAWE